MEKRRCQRAEIKGGDAPVFWSQRDKEEPAKFQQKKQISQGEEPRECDVQVEKNFIKKERIQNCVKQT